MEIINGLEELRKSYHNTVLTIGNFDGIHRGHQMILLWVIKKAKELEGTSMVITFEPHPVKVLAPEKELKMLTTFKEKARILEAIGIEVLLCVNFTREFADLSPDAFIEDVLVKKIGAKEVIIGYDYAFGKNKKGTTELLCRRGRELGFKVKTIRSVKLDGDVVSSSRIRRLLQKGKVNEVSTVLGRAYSIEGEVIQGTGRGSKILNVPTANIKTPDVIVPREGVYAVRVMAKDSFFDGVVNIGRRPTFGGSDVSYEAHLFNFSGNLLGETIRVYFIDWIRGERSFPDALSLETQIRNDIERARTILSAKHPKLI
ncbi:MAG: bifunctional riboflavin kinase/FAD synthetase [Nitrospirota bacterium]|nr:bifunctional riboflavin kinase/FAD synthetase [Nitrospirota bacterium]MDH5767370.1 bifunctional riboflavin kinase/FAD synthetase [Nitrospirota bacterium]